MANINGDSGKNHLVGTSYADLIQGFGDNDTLAGGAGTDSLWGGEGADWIDAGTWDDRAHGEAGADTMIGGGGHDYLNGGADNDSLAGDDGNDTIDGGTGTDTMIGGAGNDVYVLDMGNDQVIELAGGGTDEIQFGDLHLKADYAGNLSAMSEVSLEGRNVENMTYTAGGTFWGTGTDGANVIRSNGYATIWAKGGNDLVVTTGKAWVDMGEGNDSFQGGQYEEAVSGGAGQDRLLMGGGDDFAAGDAGNDSIDGAAGHDTLAGGAGSDTLSGGDGGDLLTTRGTYSLVWGYDAWGWGVTPAGSTSFDTKPYANGNDGFADFLYGGAGNDTLVGHSGDVLTGGEGDDTYRILTSSPATIVETETGGTGDRVVLVNTAAYVLGANLEHLQADNDSATGGASLTGNAADNRIFGTRYDDVLQGMDGNDDLDGYLGNDTARGGEGNDTVDGYDGNDSLEGGNGNDLLVGGKGVDVLVGGAGADIFRFDSYESGSAASKRDIIRDFVRGEDKVDLSLIHDATGGGEGLHLSDGVEAYGVWQGFDKPKSTGGIIAQPPGTRLMMDLDGDAVADMVVTVQFGDGLGVGTLAASDFIF